MYEHVPTTIRDMIGTNKKNAAVKEKVDRLFTDVKRNIGRNSERDFIRMSNRSGFFNLSKVNASERHGNFFALTLLMHTTYGKALLEPHFEKHGVIFDEMRETAMLLLAWDRFLLDFNERFELKMAYKATLVLMRRIKRHFPRAKRAKSKEDGEGKEGWHISKYHALLYLLTNMEKFGCAKVYHGSAAEKNHKWFVKKMAALTQMRLDSFAEQVAKNYYEFELFKMAYKHEEHNCMPKSYTNAYRYEKTTDARQDYQDLDELSDYSSNDEGIDGAFLRTDEASCRGSFTLVISTNGRHQVRSSFTWKDDEKQKLSSQYKPNPIIAKSLGIIAIRHAQIMRVSVTQHFCVECFTEASIPLKSGEETKNHLFRCTPRYHGSEWYDFAMVKLPKTKEKPNGDCCAARIISFLRYPEKTSLTFKKVECQSLTSEEAKSTRDDTMYALIQCEVGHLKYDYLSKDFVKKIILGPSDQLFIIPISSIVGPLLCIPNILDEDVVSNDQYLVAMAYHKWGKYFINFSKTVKEKYGDNELSDDEINSCFLQESDDSDVEKESSRDEENDDASSNKDVDDMDDEYDDDTDDEYDDLARDYW